MRGERLGHGNDIEAGDYRCLASPLLFELGGLEHCDEFVPHFVGMLAAKLALAIAPAARGDDAREALFYSTRVAGDRRPKTVADHAHPQRSEEHTSELQSLMRISYAVFCLKKKKKKKKRDTTAQITRYKTEH